MKITLINTPFIYLNDDNMRHSQCLGLRYISSYLKLKGFHDITFIDALHEGFSLVTPYAGGYVRGLNTTEILKRIPCDTELVGISVPFSQLAPLAHNIVASIKDMFPHIQVVIGGVFPSTSPRHALRSAADLVVVGEGEETFLQLARGIIPSKIQGVYDRTQISLDEKDFRPASLIMDLDALPFPDYSLPNMETYFERGQRAKKSWEQTAALITSRGCPFDCEFCSVHAVYGYGWRGRSAENVLAELDYVINRFGITRFEIEDDNFTFKKERTIRILEGMIRLREMGHPLEWRVPNGLRIDTIDAEIIKLFKRANCRQVILALEHGSPEMLEIMNKKLSLEKAYDVIKGFIGAGLEDIGLFIIVGYPGETEQYFNTCFKYLENLKKLGGNLTAITCIAQPYPGTKLLERCLKQGYLKENVLEDFFSCRKVWDSGQTVLTGTQDFSIAEILQRKERILHLFTH